MAKGHAIWIKDTVHKPVKGLWTKQSGAWSSVQTAWIKVQGTWQQVFPTPKAIETVTPSSITATVYSTLTTDVIAVAIGNSGDDDIIINSFVATGDAQHFGIKATATWGTSTTIAPGNTKYINVVINGLVTGTGQGTVILNTNIGAFGNNQVVIPVNVTCIPLYSRIAPITIPATSYTQTPTSTAPTFNIIVKNIGNGALTMNNITSSNSRLTFSAIPTTVASGASTTITATWGGSFLQYGQDGGTFTDTITINSSADGGAVTLPVTINVTPHGSVSFTTDSTWTVPAGIANAIDITVNANRGGNGGRDSGRGGYSGPGGLYKVKALLSAGTIAGIYIGSAGKNNTDNQGSGTPVANAPGGTNALSLGNGGFGSGAGPTPWSGGGGSGAAATVVQLRASNNVTVLGNIYAGGGAGGGGGGDGSNGGDAAWRGNSGSVTGNHNGGNGAGKGGDGGGAGGGGGGFLGGIGGKVNGGDSGGDGGQSGRNGIDGAIAATNVSTIINDTFAIQPSASVDIAW